MATLPSTLLDAIDTVSSGAVVSTETDVPSVTAVTAVPALPAVSAKEIVSDTSPSVVSSATVYVAVQLVPEPDTVADCPASATVGVVMASLDSKVTVTVSPAMATLPSPLSDAIVTDVSVGAVVSTETDEPSVTAVTSSAPALPA